MLSEGGESIGPLQEVFDGYADRAAFTSILDLRRLGYGFEQILSDTGCDRAFLMKVYEYMGLPIEARANQQTREGIEDDYGGVSDQNVTIDAISESQANPKSTTNSAEKPFEGKAEIAAAIRVNKPFNSRDWIKEMTLDISDEEAEELREKEQEIKRLKDHIAQLERKKQKREVSIEREIEVENPVHGPVEQLDTDPATIQKQLSETYRLIHLLHDSNSDLMIQVENQQNELTTLLAKYDKLTVLLDNATSMEDPS